MYAIEDLLVDIVEIENNQYIVVKITNISSEKATYRNYYKTLLDKHLPPYGKIKSIESFAKNTITKGDKIKINFE